MVHSLSLRLLSYQKEKGKNTMTTSLSSTTVHAPIFSYVYRWPESPPSVVDPALQEKELTGELQKHGGLLLKSVCNMKELAQLSELELTKQREMLGDGFAAA